MAEPHYIQETVLNCMQYFGLSSDTQSPAYLIAAFFAITIIAIAGWLLAKFVLHFKVFRLVLRSKNSWDDSLLEAGVFSRIAHLVPGILVYNIYPLLFSEPQAMYSICKYLSAAYLLVTCWLILSALLNAIEDIYSRSKLAQKAPITGFIQVTRLLMTLVLVFLLISLVLGKSPVYLLSGLTAIAAVLLLIFRDTILGFVAGIQIAANRMFNTGDWIEIPKYGVDGEIKLIGLNVVKVQNWDKTISTIPTYALTTDAVKNWRGMSESGGRRIKRSIHIDIHSIGFASQTQCDHWSRFILLKDYLSNKKVELENYNQALAITDGDIYNGRRLTNIGTFRAYIKEYLQRHPQVNHELTFMVRHLAPSELGLPIEIYCFSRNKDWVTYEGIQADIFDHILAIMPEFGLRAYQRVSNTTESQQVSDTKS